MSKIRSSFALLAGCAVALGFGGTAATAADMGLKAAPTAAPAPPPLDIHGYVEAQWDSTLVSPHGGVLDTHGAEEMVAGLDWTLYKGGQGWINSITLGGFVYAGWVEGFQGAWAFSTPAINGNFLDLVGGVIASVDFGQYWTLRDQFTMVVSEDVGGVGSTFVIISSVNRTGGGAAFAPLPANELRLTFKDPWKDWFWGITWNPYVSWFYQFENFDQAAVGTNAQTQGCFPCRPNASEFFIGIKPTWANAQKYWGIPLTISAPTYITVGPASFWTGGFANAVGTVIPCGVGCTQTVQNDGNVWVFTTGLQGIWNLKFIPANYGGWFLIGGFQWYDLINNNLVISENESIGCGFNRAVACKTDRSIWVGYFGAGVTF